MTGVSLELSILILAMASVPFGLIALHDLLSRETRRGAFGAASAAWSLSGVILVYYGVPGLLFFPGLILIMTISSLSRLRRGGDARQFVRPSVLVVLLVLITLGLVML